MMINLEGKRALVTGGSRGIGKAIFDALEDAGANVISTSTLAVDFTDDESTRKFLDGLKELHIDILVNNAGICINNFIEDISYEDFRKVQKVNVDAPFLVTQAVIGNMKKNNYGRIVNISSIKSIGSAERRLAYATSKSALNGITRTSAVDLAPYNILVNSISPGFTNTELTASMLSKYDKEELMKRIPMKRFAEVEEIANAVLFFVSDKNTFITGQNIIIDGGYTINL